MIERWGQKGLGPFVLLPAMYGYRGWLMKLSAGMRNAEANLLSEDQPRKAQRADAPPAEGFTLVLNDHYKTQY